MKPLVMSGRKWRELVRISAGLVGERPNIAMIVFRPRDVVVTNGHVMFAAPLAEDAKRDVAVSIGDVWPWLKGLKLYADTDDYGATVWSRYQITIAEAPTGDLALYTDKIGGTLLVPARPASERIPDSSLDMVLDSAKDGPPPQHILAPRYLAMLRRLHREFGDRNDGVTIAASAAADATLFRFHSMVDGHQGTASFVVMKLREHTPNSLRFFR